MGYESIAHEVEGRMGYWLRGHEGETKHLFASFYRQNITNMEVLFATSGL